MNRKDHRSTEQADCERVEATFAQALALLVLFLLANIACRAVVYPLASMAYAGCEPAVKPEADGEEVE